MKHIITVSPKNTKEPAKEPRIYPSSHDLTYNYNSKRARTDSHFRDACHNEPSPLDRFLGITYMKHGRGLRKSTYIIGVTLFYMLREGPKIVNVSQLSRDTGYSTRTVNKALAYYSKFWKIRRINERRTGKRRPCMYKLDDSFIENQESAKPQEKRRCEVSGNSHSIRSLRTKDLKKNQPRQPHSGSFTLESYKNMQKTFQLMPRDKKKLSAIARKTCEPGLISAALDVLYQRDPVAGVWLSVIRTLQNLSIDESEKELTWRARKGIAGLIGGLSEDGFRAIMLDTVSEEEATKREVARIQYRIAGCRQWRVDNPEEDYESWYVEMRATLERMLLDAQDGIRYDNNDNRVDEQETVAGNGKAKIDFALWEEFEKKLAHSLEEEKREEDAETNTRILATRKTVEANWRREYARGV